MRARMALKLANIEVEIREISLREKPAHMLQVSAKGTVPVLVLADGSVIDESLEIMCWAFNHARGQNDALQANIHEASRLALECYSPVASISSTSTLCTLILLNDTEFKKNLDGYKYPERFPSKTQTQHRVNGEVFLQQLENLLQQKPYLFASTPSFADYAIFPFIRQFAAVDSTWFAQSDYPKLKAWLDNWIESDLFKNIMKKNPTCVG